MIQNLKVGDWVNSYSKGIYRIEKIIDRYFDESDIEANEGKKIGKKYDERIIVSKRLLNSKLKKSISYESCSEYFISLLTKEQYSQLQNILSQKPELLNELDKYTIPAIETIFNMPLKINNKKELAQVNLLIEFIEPGKTFLEINAEIKRLGILHLLPANYGNYILQMSNFDEELIKKRRIWRNARLTKAG